MTEFHDRRSGTTTDHTPDVSSTLSHLYGSQDLDLLFPEQIAKAPSPFPRVAQRKHQQTYDPALVHEELSKPVTEHSLVDVDPRMLKGTQPHVIRPATQHYMGGEYERTGRTWADREKVGNQFPFVYGRHKNGETEDIILAGHNRAAAALLQGRPLRARRVEGGWGPER
jgi:hypothetical protein